MMHPTIPTVIANARQEQLRRKAEQQRLARLARSRPGDDRIRSGALAAKVLN